MAGVPDPSSSVPAAAARLRLALLGPFMLADGGETITIPTKKNRALLAILALAPKRQATRERLCGLLWGDRGEEQARSSLRQSLAVLRKELGAAAGIIQTRDDLVWLDGIAVDADEAADHRDLARAAAAHRGELLADTAIREESFEQWLAAERRRLADNLAVVLESLGEAGSGPSAIAAAKRLVEADPLREASHRLLMRAYAAAGEIGLALQQFDACKTVLAAEFGVAPAAETMALRATIANGGGRPADSSKASAGQAAAHFAEEASVAVLPFANLSSDTEQQYIADGLTEDLIAELCKVPGLMVIAAQTMLKRRGGDEAAEGLGARFVVRGSLRRTAEGFWLNAQAAETASGRVMWAEHLACESGQINFLVVEVARKLAAVLGASYPAQGRQRRPVNPEAFDLCMRGRSALRASDEDGIRARPLFERAVAIDPHYAEPLRYMAECDSAAWLFHNAPMVPFRQRAVANARKAVELDPSDAAAHSMFAFTLLYERQWDEAEAEFNEALRLNPNDAETWARLSDMRALEGKGKEALTCSLRSLRLNPQPFAYYYWLLGQAQFAAGDFEAAVRTLMREETYRSASRRILAAALVELGRLDEAREEARLFMAASPHFTIAHWVETQPFRDLGMRDRFVNAYRKAGLPDGTAAAPQPAAPERVSIAVLPFANLGGEAGQQYLADGLTQDLITALARLPGALVIAQESAFAFRHAEESPSEIARHLGVRYLVQGSVRREGGRLRINAHLTDARDLTVMWSGRLERQATEVFAAQDEMVAAIVAALPGQVAMPPGERYRPSSLEAYELCVKARNIWGKTLKSGPEVRPMLERAIALEPGYAEAWRWLAMVNLIGWLYLGEAEEPWRKLALTQAKRALELDPTDPDGHWVYGAALFYERQWDEAARETTLAVTLNPNCADGWSNLADMRLLDGDAREALACAKRCWQLNPVTSTIAYWVLAQAHFALGNFEEAVRTLRGSGTGGASARRDLAAALAELGRMGEARAEAALFMADFPHFTIAHWVETQPFRDLGMRDRFVNAYRKAGLPEGRANQSAAKPSVAVLPFANLGGDPQQDFIADGLSEDLIMELGQFLELRVIAHHSSFAFRGGTTPLAEIARQLDVRYVVEGSVRKAGPELRVSARLADVSNHTQLWSGRYDRPAEAVAEIRDDLVRSVAAAIQGHVAADDAARAQRKPPASWTAYEHFLRGRSLSLRYRDREALPFLERAAELDPGNSTIQAWRAIVLALNFLHDPDGDWLDRAFVAAQTALALSDTDPRCHHAMAVVRDWRGEFERAGEHYARARELSPADLIIIYDHAAWFNHTGRPAEALALLDRARRDDPLPPPFAQKLRGIFLFQLGHYEEAIGEMERLAEPFPWADALLASAYALTGRMEEAARHVHRLKKLMPGANLASAERSLGSCTPELARSYVEGLRLAGLGDD